MSLYIGLFSYLLIIGFLCFYSKNSFFRNAFKIITFLILAFILCFRSYEVGSDSVVYKTIFEQTGSFSLNITELFSSRFELGFLFTNEVMYKISHDYTVMFLFFGGLTLIFWFYGMEKLSKDMYLSLIIFYNFRFFTFAMSNIRQSFAISLLIVSFIFLVKKRYMLFSIIVIIASFFHLPAIIFLVCILLDKIKLSKKWFIAGGIGAVVAFFSFDRLLALFLGVFSKYSSYLSTDYFSGEVKISTIINSLIYISVFIAGELSINNFKKDRQLNLLRNIVFLTTLLSIISINSAMVNRFTLYFGAFIVIYIPEIIYHIKSKGIKSLVFVGIIILFTCYNFVIMYLKPEWNIIIPYKSVIF
ncbi:EpsG family protein [Enterococcus faecalis]|uniref:EpsG family protein n=1 Tax=Enterococcus faecalis TaxID=1351 RepID=UPI000CF071B5|nr:EpsG family protein [Enterococcus faecium]PQC45133.1 hypothetical protein CUM89_04165 [Enterococcus faecalis]EMF0443805.1 EpsG family protein [Enterococcus faecium]PQF97073.1 hypothetical protein CUS50_11560 [Enterococcus faecalis]ROX67734.1 EpsG family protein [Enterococcus faecalis]